MREVGADTLRGANRGTRLRQQLDSPPVLRDAISEFVVVRKQIRERLEPADFREPLAGGGHGRAEHEFYSFELPRPQPTRQKIRCDADGFESRTKLATAKPRVHARDPSHAGVAGRS